MKRVFISLLVIFSLFCVGCKSRLIDVEKNKTQDTNKYNIYLERDERIIYVSSNIDELYYNGMSFKEYLSMSFQTMDDSLSHITSLLDNVDTIRDGGTKIYRSKDYDITIITCNRIDVDKTNRDVYIGDVNLKFDNDMCNR
ncbi:MAG: hypothetical protein J6X02_01015 [Bacilli bacterium]|nr:hypothetical protein [Bacilli bacterium]